MSGTNFIAMAVSFSETIILALASAPTFQHIPLLVMPLVEEDLALAAATSHPPVAVTTLPVAVVTVLLIIPIMIPTNLRPTTSELARQSAKRSRCYCTGKRKMRLKNTAFNAWRDGR